MTLDIPTELEMQLERAARARGTDAQTLLLEAARLLMEGAPESIEQREERDAKRQRLALELRGSASSGSPSDDTAETKRLAAVNRLYGCLAKSDFTVDDFLHERSAEGRKEAGL